MWRDCCREKYLDDLHVVCQPDRVGDVHTAVGQELWRHSSLHHGKTKDACATLTARLVDPRAVLWRGDTSLPRREQGLVILGIRKGPVGEEDNGAQRVKNPSGMVVAHFCAPARVNFIMRPVRPELAEAFATPQRQRVGVFRFSSECECRARGLGFRSVVKETLPSRSVGHLGRHRGLGARKAPRSAAIFVELDARHGRGVNEQRVTVPAQVGWCWF